MPVWACHAPAEMRLVCSCLEVSAISQIVLVQLGSSVSSIIQPVVHLLLILLAPFCMMVWHIGLHYDVVLCIVLVPGVVETDSKTILCSGLLGM